MREIGRDIELSERERCWLAQRVGVDEELLLLVRPRMEPLPGQFAWERGMSCIWLLR